MAQCQFTKINGKRCRAPAITGSKFCFFHDPSQAARRKEAQTSGGLASSRARSGAEWEPVEPLALATIEDIVKLMTEQLNELRGLEPSPAKGRSIFYGISLLIRLYEVLVLERRLTEIEAFLNVEVEAWLWSRNRRSESGIELAP